MQLNNYLKSKFSNWLINRLQQDETTLEVDCAKNDFNHTIHHRDICSYRCCFEKQSSKILSFSLESHEETNVVDIASRLENSYIWGSIPSMSSAQFGINDLNDLEYSLDDQYALLKSCFAATHILPEIKFLRHKLTITRKRERLLRGDTDRDLTSQWLNFEYSIWAFSSAGEHVFTLNGRGFPGRSMLEEFAESTVKLLNAPLSEDSNLHKKVILMPQAFAFLLERLIFPALRNVTLSDIPERGYGLLNLADNPFGAHSSCNRGFDFEGVIRKRKVLVENGKIKEPLSNLKSNDLCFDPGNAVSFFETDFTDVEVNIESEPIFPFEKALEGYCYIPQLKGFTFSLPDGKFTLKCDNPIQYKNGKIYRLPSVIISGDMFDILADAVSSRLFRYKNIMLPYIHSNSISIDKSVPHDYFRDP